ncbi:hypothetical protein [Gilvibacter sp.]|uniref:hypothetical protein n=1 Tax=Gilvibacter sp. TaxID=2729997 RepID=UPI003B52A6D1
MQKWFLKGLNPLVILWILLSLLLLFCTAKFRLNDYIYAPQHGQFDNFELITQYIQNSGKIFWYNAFFIVDFFWALSFLFLLVKLVLRMNNWRFARLKETKFGLFQLFVLGAIMAYVFDFVEGLGYLFFWKAVVSIFAKAKIAAYALTIGLFGYWGLKRFVFSDFRSWFRFFQSSILSIVFIAIVYLLLTAMPQGGTLIVDLFNNPWNIVLLFALLTFLAIILSHFPVYVDIWLYGHKTGIKLFMAKTWHRFKGWGIIYYGTHLLPGEKPAIEFGNKLVSSLRRSLGILLYIAMFHIILGVAEGFYDLAFNATQITVFLLILSLVIYAAKGQEYDFWKETLKSPNCTAAQKQQVVETVVTYVDRFPKYFAFCLFMVGATTVAASVKGWGRLTVFLFLITLGLQLFLYIYFKLCRTYFKYVFYSDALYKYNPKMFDETRRQLFIKYHTKPGIGKRWYLKQFGKLSDNIRYLLLMQVSGVSSFVILLAANFSFEIAQMLNPLVIILLYIILFYSIIIISFKHILFYQRSATSEKKYREWFRYGIPVTVLLLIGWAVYSTGLPNDLHELTVLKRERPQLDSKKYFQQRTAAIPAGGKRNFFFVGSYGGGLKANLWNMLLFHELDKRSDGAFSKETLVMSGVSGGAVGIANYASIVNENSDLDARAAAIFNIGTSNVLSNELVYLLGKDWLREYIPLTYQGRDRSYKSMQDHARYTGMGDRYQTKTFSDYWWELQQKQAGKFPILIMNTTSTIGRQGVVSTVNFEPNTFPAADNLSDFNNSCGDCGLTYFGAVSTTNRFPLFSPSAEIRGKGTYVDGGYFENSGMLSTLEIYQTLKDESGAYHSKIQPVFVNIINSLDFYVAHKVLKDWKFKKVTQDKSGELSAILNTVVSIDKLPRYVFDKIEKEGFVLEPIMMPHRITYERVKSVLRGDVDDPVRLMKLIKQHNDTIRWVLRDYENYKLRQWGVVEPPLARVLSEPAVRYQEAMVYYHPEVQRAFARIDAYLNTPEIIDNSFKQRIQRTIKADTLINPYQKFNKQ